MGSSQLKNAIVWEALGMATLFPNSKFANFEGPYATIGQKSILCALAAVRFTKLSSFESGLTDWRVSALQNVNIYV